ncbi:MAG: hypothetical protein K5767_08595 [Clostridia bacterium]|nr:hypothetical protein [Clostridia bacterium]
MRTDYKASRDNSIATALYYLGWFVIVAGTIGAVGMISIIGAFFIVLLYSGFASGALILGIAEIIFILDDSRKRLYLLTESKSDNEAEPEKLPEL